jgi:hypothetical protein
MAIVPTYSSQLKLKPAEWDPKVAGAKGADIQDLGQGLKSLGQTIQKLDDRRQTLKAETYLAKQHMQIRQMAATDPHIDQLDEMVDQRSQDAVSEASNFIQSPEARASFVSNANLDIERRNVGVYNTILRRKSQDFKNELVQANDADIQEYQGMTDPDERKLLRQKIIDRTNQAINDGHVNADWARAHATTLLKAADLNQVKSDMAINATATYQELSKGKDGLYPNLNDAQRKQFADRAQKMITKEGADNKLIYGIAQNHAESQLVDKMAAGTLTQQDINNAQLMGNKGIRIRPEFAKAATQAMEDPFPTDSAPDKYNKLLDKIQDPDMDPMTLKLNVLNSRGLTPAEKAHLINAHLREDSEDGKQSINDLINQGIKQNKQKLMQAQKNLQAEITDRQSLLRKITDRFRDHAKDDANLAGLQKDYMSKLQNVKDDSDRLQLAQQIMNNDTLKRNPGIATSDPKGTVMLNKITGQKRKYYPSGFWEPVKTDEQ